MMAGKGGVQESENGESGYSHGDEGSSGWEIPRIPFLGQCQGAKALLLPGTETLAGPVLIHSQVLPMEE